MVCHEELRLAHRCRVWNAIKVGGLSDPIENFDNCQ